MENITTSTFLPAIFWLIMGMLNLIFILFLRWWFRELNVKLTKIKWLCLIGWWVILLLTICASFTLIGEDELQAGLRFFGFFLIPLLISGFIIFRWIFKKIIIKS